MYIQRNRYPLACGARAALVFLAAGAFFAACGGAGISDAPANPAPTPGGSAGEPDRPVATVNGEVITARELDKVVRSELKKAREEFEDRSYELKKNALDLMISEKLVEAAATKAGLSPELFLRRELKARSTPPTEEMIREIYRLSAEQYGDQIPPYEQAEEGIRAALVEQLELEARRDYLESLRDDAEVRVTLSPPEKEAVVVPTDGPSRGDPASPVTIVEFADFECPFCVRAQATLEQIMKSYPGKVRVVFKDFPLSFHRFAVKAAEAAHCAGDQGKYWEMHGLLYENSDALREVDLKAYAADLKLDRDRFDSCLDSSEKAAVVEASAKQAESLGLSGSPSFFINGRLLVGALPFSRFREIIDDELAKPGR